MVKRMTLLTILSMILLVAAVFLGMATGSSGLSFKDILAALTSMDSLDRTSLDIIWRIRFPRVMLAGMEGAALSLGGLVFQALLRNPLAEPYILGISGGAAVGAISGILLGFGRFPGVSGLALVGSLAAVFVALTAASHQKFKRQESLILSGVMVNALCSSLIMLFVSLASDYRLHNILFWLMGDLSSAELKQLPGMAFVLVPCFFVIGCCAHPMNLLLMGEEMAADMGVNVPLVSWLLLVVTSVMVSISVCYSGPLGFVGLVIPHLLRLGIGPDHRLLVPCCIFGGGSYLICCDTLARVLPAHGELPVGVITAMIGAPLFIFLLRRSSR